MPRRGENIYKRKDGRWEGRYIKDHVNKKIMYGYVYAKTYREVKEKLSLISDTALKKENVVVPTTKSQLGIDFKTVSLAWVESLKPQLKESSIVKYTNVLENYLLPYFKDNTIETITREDILNFSYGQDINVSNSQQRVWVLQKLV